MEVIYGSGSELLMGLDCIGVVLVGLHPFPGGRDRPATFSGAEQIGLHSFFSNETDRRALIFGRVNFKPRSSSFALTF